MDVKKRVEVLLSKLNDSIAKLNIPGLEAERQKLASQMAEHDFWHTPQKAASITQQEAKLAQKTSKWLKLQAEVEDVAELVKDDSLATGVSAQLDELEDRFQSLMSELRFSGPYDDYSVILSIYAGAGGTDAQDWAQMLQRMYTRWAEAQPAKVEVLDLSSGEEAGIKSVTLRISGGEFLYGKLSGEHGVHRMVRKSPFNASHSRETSFARVDVLPEINEPSEVEIDEKDLKVDVFRSGGAGGQSVNTTDSAVRVTHLPTGITVSIQNERSQLQNKETAMTILRSRLAQLQLEQHAQNLAELKGPPKSAEFGNQIRNYVLDDRIVKDLRTGFESHNPEKILDGELGPLVDAWLGRH